MSSIVAPAAALAPRAAVRASRSRVASSRSVAFSPANVRATRPRQVSLAAKPKEKDVDWDAKTKEMTAERIMESCLEAMADGDENQLEACLLELEDESERADVIDNLQKTPQVKGDKFWQEKLKEIAAERVLDNCMAAVMSGDVDEIEACMLDANNDTLLGVDVTTAEDGTKTFRF